MAAKLFQDTIKEIEVVHRTGFSPFRGRQRFARIVVWATMNSGERVWVCTVEGGLDTLEIGIKVAMCQEYFKSLSGFKIKFHQGKFESEDTFFAEEETLPQEFLVSYQEVKKKMWSWVKVKYAEELERLRKDRSGKAAATRKINAEEREADRKRRATKLGLPEDTPWKKIEKAEEEEYVRRDKARLEADRKRQAASLGLPEDSPWSAIYNAQAEANRKRQAAWQAEYEQRRQKELEEQRKNALWLSFRKGRNPKHGNEQWEARHEGLLFILRREDKYDASEGKIPVEESFELVPDKIMLVQRI